MATQKEYTGKAFFRDEEGTLFVALSYIDKDGETQTDTFQADEATGEIIQ
jgi:hypothetical protein